MKKSVAALCMAALMLVGAACSKSSDDKTATSTSVKETATSVADDASSSDTTEGTVGEGSDTTLRGARGTDNAASVQCPTQAEVDEVNVLIGGDSEEIVFTKAYIERMKKGVPLMLDIYTKYAKRDNPEDVAVLEKQFNAVMDVLNSIDLSGGDVSEATQAKVEEAFMNMIAGDEVGTAVDNIMAYWSACEDVSFDD